MWNRAWHSVGTAAAFAARSAAGARWLRRSTGRVLRGKLQTDLATILVGVTAARLCGVASAVLRRRVILVISGIQVSISALAKVLSIRGGPSPSIKAVREQAKRMAQLLGERDITLNRIGIDGVPGSGKSTLARALAESLDMKWKSLDHKNLRLPGTLSSERTVYEHHRLFRTQDVDAFDVIVYIDEPFESSKAKVRRRGRGLVLAAVLDYEKLKKVGKLAFDVCEGEPVPIPDSDLVLKVKPRKGFRAVENVASRLSAARPPRTTAGESKSPAPHDTAGFDTSGMSKEEMLLLLACGKRQHGLKAYLLPLAYVARIGSLAAAVHSAGRRFVTAWCADDSAGRHRGALPEPQAAPSK